MDKEMQAKVEEFIRTQGRQQLNPDDLDQVVGGAVDLSTHEKADAYFALVEAIYNNFVTNNKMGFYRYLDVILRLRMFKKIWPRNGLKSL